MPKELAIQDKETEGVDAFSSRVPPQKTSKMEINVITGQIE
jgi:hypothetical protein